MVKKPNILIILTDEERYPPVYETAELAAWRKSNLPAHELLRSHGLEFRQHYIASSACCPSRTSLFTGQYPSLHGVTQTPGAAKRAFDPDMLWLDANTVPTLGDYFRLYGYRTFYKGKWHISRPDILIPGTQISFSSYDNANGVPQPAKEKLYLEANRLDAFGFEGWIGPEPHGPNPHDSGSSAAHGISGRDEAYASMVTSLLDLLEEERMTLARSGSSPQPWLIVASFVNPHDIVLYGDYSALSPHFRFPVSPSIPRIPYPPTYQETLADRPRCQRSYRDVYPLAFQPISDMEHYFRLYYQLQQNVDTQMLRVLDKLQQASFYEETIVIFTSDHGELLGAHGGLHQKFYCAYQEALHVPLIVHNPRLFREPQQLDIPTSHIDLLPTILGLAGADPIALQKTLRTSHTETRPLPGRNLCDLVAGKQSIPRLWEPLYFMTADDPTRGLNQVSLLGVPYHAVIPPKQIETVIASLQTVTDVALWKYSRYFDPTGVLPDEWELYNLTADPEEQVNLADASCATTESRRVQQAMAQLLEQQARQKRLTPASHNR
ncbi:MAG: sulfatase-like hydrolase/transferase [Clostridia bacterium]